jgi:microcin C transport system substrate-binding protein
MIGRLNFGRDITYERDPNYWARDLNVRRGRYNFDRVTYKIYKDTTAQTEAFKAGEFDYLRTFSAREWARTYVGKKFESGELVKVELPTKNAGDFQGFLINTRRAKFKDPRVRQALGLAFDFEWMNRQMMYNAYTRVRGFFNASDFEAKGMPGPDELKVLESLRENLPEKVFTEEVPMPPSTHPPGSLRDNLRKARDLLAEAGWTYRDGALRNAKGESFTLEYLDSGGGERLVAPYFQALAKLGITGEYRRADFALIRKRLDVFDYDIFTVRVPGSESPGAELLDRFGSQSADTEGSSNLVGVKDPAIDALVNLAVSSRTRPELVARLRALDRVLRHHYFVIPQWYASTSASRTAREVRAAESDAPVLSSRGLGDFDLVEKTIDVVVHPQASAAHDPDAVRDPAHHVHRDPVRSRRAGRANGGPVPGLRGWRRRAGGGGGRLPRAPGRRRGTRRGDQEALRLRQAGARALRADDRPVCALRPGQELLP